MLVASRATAGPTPCCIECGAKAHFIDLNASWRASCGHFNYDLVTERQLEADVENARQALRKARTRLRTYRALPVSASPEPR